ncbi:hypothetical protein Tco_0540411 [Tanacetum coccineum]
MTVAMEDLGGKGEERIVGGAGVDRMMETVVWQRRLAGKTAEAAAVEVVEVRRCEGEWCEDESKRWRAKMWGGGTAISPEIIDGKVFRSPENMAAPEFGEKGERGDVGLCRMGTPTQYLCDYWNGWVRLPRCDAKVVCIYSLSYSTIVHCEVKEELFGDCYSRLRSILSEISFEVLLACCLVLVIGCFGLSLDYGPLLEFLPLSGCDIFSIEIFVKRRTE